MDRTSSETGASSLLRVRPTVHKTQQASSRAGFTLLELLIVVGIIGLLLVMTAPAFTYIKGGTDVTSAAYTVKGVLDTARTYAKANNTYVWVGFYEEDVSQPSPNPSPAPTPVGRVVMSIVASRDGTNAVPHGGTIDPTKVIQVGKLTKIENVHLATFPDGSGQSTTFATRPPVTYLVNGTQMQYSIANFLNPNVPTLQFTYPIGSPYTFVTAIQFSPRGEARINNDNYSIQKAAEIVVQPTHGTDTNSPNLVAVQFTGIGGAVTIYRQ